MAGYLAAEDVLGEGRRFQLVLVKRQVLQHHGLARRARELRGDTAVLLLFILIYTIVRYTPIFFAVVYVLWQLAIPRINSPLNH